MKDKFEDRLQTFVLWVIFFNICLGAVYSRPTLNEGHGDKNSLFVNVTFLILNCAVLVVAVGKSSDQNFFFRSIYCNGIAEDFRGLVGVV